MNYAYDANGEPTPMLYGQNAYGEHVEQSEPRLGQGFLTPDREAVYFVQWDPETMFAVCVNSTEQIAYYAPVYLCWLPCRNRPTLASKALAFLRSRTL